MPGQLVAERFARSGRHDQQNVLTVDDGLADGLLIGAEGREAEGLVEKIGQVSG